MPTQCPKCGHVRSANETAPDWECPSCGIVYAKYRPPAPLLATPAQPLAIQPLALAAEAPRASRRPRGLLTIALLFLLAPLFIWLSVLQHRAHAALAGHGQITTATIGRLEFKKNRITGAHTSYMGEAHFKTADDRDAIARVSLPDDMARAIEQGGPNTIQIRYLPETPTMAELPDHPYSSGSGVFLALIVVGMAVWMLRLRANNT